MNGKERVLKALRFEKTDRVPWVPFTGVHVAKLVGSDAPTLLTCPEVLVDAVTFRPVRLSQRMRDAWTPYLGEPVAFSRR